MAECSQGNLGFPPLPPSLFQPAGPLSSTKPIPPSTDPLSSHLPLPISNSIDIPPLPSSKNSPTACQRPRSGRAIAAHLPRQQAPHSSSGHQGNTSSSGAGSSSHCSLLSPSDQVHSLLCPPLRTAPHPTQHLQHSFRPLTQMEDLASNTSSRDIFFQIHGQQPSHSMVNNPYPLSAHHVIADMPQIAMISGSPFSQLLPFPAVQLTPHLSFPPPSHALQPLQPDLNLVQPPLAQQ